MGLDMYLYAKKTKQEVAYWRKANAIHGWFERLSVRRLGHGIEDCDATPVGKEDLKVLVNECKAVLADHSLASAVLPVRSGFFFGSYEYEDWYFQILKNTVEQLEPLIEGEEEEFEYVPWW